MTFNSQFSINNDIKKYKPKEAVLASTLKLQNDKMGIAEIVTKARNENFRIIQRKEVEPLKEIALRKVAESNGYIEANKLDQKSKELVYEMMDISDDIVSSFDKITYEKYWKRACAEKFKTADVSMHGNSWKQCFAENYVQKIIINSNDYTEDYITQIFKLMRNYVFNLTIPYFSADFSLNMILDNFHNLCFLELKYSPNLLEKEKGSIYLKDIDPIKDEYSKFGMRIPSLKHFALKLKDMQYLLELNLQGNFLDEEMIKWLTSGLISNYSIGYLNLSNNLLDSKSVIRLCSYLLRSRTLISIDLSNNKIEGEGGHALSLIIKENTNLKSLKVGMNLINDENCARIIKSLEKNTNLEELDLSANKLSEYGSQAIEYSFSRNETLRSIDLSNTLFSLTKECRQILEDHKSLVKMDLSLTKVSNEEKEDLIRALIRKEVRIKRRNNYMS